MALNLYLLSLVTEVIDSTPYFTEYPTFQQRI